MDGEIPGRRSSASVGLVLAVVSTALAAGPSFAEAPTVSELNPNAPAPVGFIAPTLDGDWRFRASLQGWMPNALDICANTGGGDQCTRKDLGWILDNLKFYIPIDLQARKGSFGFFVNSLLLGLDGGAQAGPVLFDWDNTILMFDTGFSYELGRWALCDDPGAPELTLEPFLAARLSYNPVNISIGGGGTNLDLSSYVPILGMRAYLDLTEHWNLAFEGDYGGFGIDDNDQTWQGVAMLGYRWPGWGAHWNLQVGYRAMGLFDLDKPNADIKQDARGAQVSLSIDF